MYKVYVQPKGRPAERTLIGTATTRGRANQLVQNLIGSPKAAAAEAKGKEYVVVPEETDPEVEAFANLLRISDRALDRL